MVMCAVLFATLSVRRHSRLELSWEAAASPLAIAAAKCTVAKTTRHKSERNDTVARQFQPFNRARSVLLKATVVTRPAIIPTRR